MSGLADATTASSEITVDTSSGSAVTALSCSFYQSLVRTALSCSFYQSSGGYLTDHFKEVTGR